MQDPHKISISPTSCKVITAVKTHQKRQNDYYRNRAWNTDHDFLLIPPPSFAVPYLLPWEGQCPAHTDSDLQVKESASKNIMLTAIAVHLGVLASNCKRPWSWQENWVHLLACSGVCIHGDSTFPEDYLEMLSGKQNKNSDIHDLGNKSTQKGEKKPGQDLRSKSTLRWQTPGRKGIKTLELEGSGPHCREGILLLQGLGAQGLSPLMIVYHSCVPSSRLGLHSLVVRSGTAEGGEGVTEQPTLSTRLYTS